MKRTPTRDIIFLFVGTRLALVIVTYLSYILLTAPKYSSAPVDIVALLTSWNHWDSANFVRIAQYNYQTAYDTAFFPLLPLLIFILAHLLGGWNGSYQLAGMLISNGALLGTLFVSYQIASDAQGDQVARRSLLYLCIFPTAFYFFSAYNESLFILLVISAFLAMRRQRWWLAGLLGMLAALTRSAGILLVVPYLWEVWVTRESIAAMRWRANQLLRFFPVVLVPLGTAIYSCYCWYLYNAPLSFAIVQEHWARHTSWPWIGIWQSLYEIFWNQPFGSFNEAHNILDLSATVGFLLLAILGWRKLRMSYNIWIALLLLYALVSPATGQHDALVSSQRLVLEMFPGFITLAALGITYPRLHQALMLIFPILLAILSMLFIMNRWMV